MPIETVENVKNSSKVFSGTFCPVCEKCYTEPLAYAAWPINWTTAFEELITPRLQPRLRFKRSQLWNSFIRHPIFFTSPHPFTFVYSSQLCSSYLSSYPPCHTYHDHHNPKYEPCPINEPLTESFEVFLNNNLLKHDRHLYPLCLSIHINI